MRTITSTSAIVLAKHALACAITCDYVNWAISSLSVGDDTPNPRILAGMDLSEALYEVEPVLLKAKRELGLASPTEEEASRDYSLGLASLILEPSSDYASIVGLLSSLCFTHEYLKYLIDWYFLNDKLADIATEGYPHSFEKLYGNDATAVVR
jgi:hypothetical protein